MKTSVIVWLAKVLVVSLCLSASSSRAQDQPSVKTQADPEERAVSSYRLDFSINELEEGHKINTRQYSLNLNAGRDPNTVKIGTRVPVEVKQGEMQYIDVGTNVWSRIKEHDNGLALEVRAEMTNFASPEQASRGVSSMPLLRQMQINASTLIVPGKPMVVGSVDDPNSKRQFQLEVTVTRLK